MAGGFHDLDDHAAGGEAEGQLLAVGKAADLVRGLGAGAVADPGAGGLGEFQVAGHKVGVEVRVEDALDAQAVGRGVVQVLRDVPARVNHDGTPGFFVAQEVGGVGQATKVVLLENHDDPFAG